MHWTLRSSASMYFWGHHSSRRKYPPFLERLHDPALSVPRLTSRTGSCIAFWNSASLVRNAEEIACCRFCTAVRLRMWFLSQCERLDERKSQVQRICRLRIPLHIVVESWGFEWARYFRIEKKLQFDQQLHEYFYSLRRYSFHVWMSIWILASVLAMLF